ncbi:MAG TPA: PadR family transcriptional regulator [Vicinamibacterales bacterium]
MRFHHRHRDEEHGHNPWRHWARRHSPFGMFDWGNEHRARRGDVKFIVLGALAEKPMHGYDIIQSLEQRHEGRYRPSPGSIYPTLQMLEDGGFVTSEQIDGKRVYTITDAGKTMLAERGEGAEHDSDGDTGFDRSAMRDSAIKFIAAVKQGGMHEDPRVREQVWRVVDDARKSIYKILAEDK